MRRVLITTISWCMILWTFAQGTVLVKDIWPGFTGSIPVFIGEVNDKVIFHAQDGLHGAEPWVTDGTEAGTFMLQDILEGPYDSSFPRPGINYNGYLYFFAGSESEYTHDLWRTDGTVAGTESFLNVLPGDGDIGIYGRSETFKLFGGYLYFLDAHPTELNMVALWRTDGTIQGTEMVYGALNIGRYFRTSLGVFGDHLYFPVQLDSGGGEQALYRIDLDGNAQEVFVLSSFGSLIGYPTAAANGLYFFGEDQTNGRELYWTDGTTTGTHMNSSFPGTGVTGYSNNYDHSWCHLDGDTLLFKADGGAEGPELWRSDGTQAGTHLLKDLLPGQFGATPMSFFEMGDEVFFTGFTMAGGDSSAIWVTDGTEAGTTQLFTLSSPELYGVNDGMLYLAGNFPRELYFSQGGVNDTVLATSPDVSAACCGLVGQVLPALGGYFISAYVDGVGEELFFYGNDVGIPVRSDEPARGVRPVPVVDHLFVDVDPSTPARVRICTSVGEEVIASALLTPDKGVDVITLPPGLYIITVVQEGTTWSQRFIKL